METENQFFEIPEELSSRAPVEQRVHVEIHH